MAENNPRSNPDEILALAKAEEEQKKRGKLKIFLGYAAGVGKTYTMLEAARHLEGKIDVAVAYIETHGRIETEALLEGLELIPRKQIEYRGVTLTEMDLDAILVRQPMLALVDELAHTNAEGSRHPKRYQDVEELLDAGIDVYTTLNVQHIESLRNLVMQITGIWMRETIPDSVIDKATEIELVDLPPDDLIKRLDEGKVYVSEQIAQATTKFFRKGNLTALRELTMRTAAESVDKQKQTYMQTHAISGPWSTAERILVCISHKSRGNLVRTARRMASQSAAEWFAVHVETPDDIRLSPSQRDRLMYIFRLAERLGAKTVTVPGDSVAAVITEYAAKNNITRIVIGKPKNRWGRLLRRSSVDQIIRQSKQVDVLVVAGEETPPKLERSPSKRKFRNWRGYLQGLALVALATLLGELLHQFFSPTSIIMIYILCVAITAVFWGFGPSILVCIVSVLTWDFFFVKPIRTFAVADTQYIFAFITLAAVGIIISYLMTRIRQQTKAAQRRESETAILYSLSRNLVATTSLEATIHAIVGVMKETFGYNVIIFLPDTQKREVLRPYVEEPSVAVDEAAMAAATWSFQHQKTSGYGTDTLPGAKERYLPLSTARGTVGVMALSVTDAAAQFTVQQTQLLKAFADLAAVSIEHIQLAEEVRNAEILKATEKLQTALLNSISHDLRTPLVSVIGVLSSLQEKGIDFDDAARENLIQVAREEAERLNYFITNLLDVSRIEAGAIKLSLQPSDAEDIIGAALEQLGGRAENHPIKINIPANLSLMSVDFGLIVQVLVNILDNALKYSKAGSPIEVSGRQVAQQVEISVADRGPGIPSQDLLRVFDKFYRVQRPGNVTGTGLGLAICKGLVEAHEGRISAENRSDGGTIIRLTLPATEAVPKDVGART